MTQIARVYDNWRNAAEAVNELKKRGIGIVAVVNAPQDTRDSTGRSSSADAIVAAIEEAGLKAAETYAERVNRGGSLVVVDAPFGAAQKATRILERHGPGETTNVSALQRGGPSERRSSSSDATAAPASAALRTPLSRDSTPSLAMDQRTLSSVLGVPELTERQDGFASLSANQNGRASLSSNQNGRASLSGYQHGRSSLSRNQNGHASLINNPAPLSGLLRLPVLLNQQRTSSGASRADMKTLDDLFVHTLQDVYYAENKITHALPDMISKATNPKLRQGFEKHLEETREQVKRLEQVFRMHGHEPRAVTCPAINGIIKEAEDVSLDAAGEGVLDAALVASAQAVEHYEITRYGSLIAWARQLGRDDCASVLEQTLQEEKAADQALTEVAGSLANARAA